MKRAQNNSPQRPWIWPALSSNSLPSSLRPPARANRIQAIQTLWGKNASPGNNDHHTKPRHGDTPLLATSPLRHTISSCQLTTEMSGVFASHKPEKNPPEPASLQPPSLSPRISDASLDSLRNLRRAAPSANSPTASTMSCPVKIRAPPKMVRHVSRVQTNQSPALPCPSALRQWRCPNCRAPIATLSGRHVSPSATSHREPHLFHVPASLTTVQTLELRERYPRVKNKVAMPRGCLSMHWNNLTKRPPDAMANSQSMPLAPIAFPCQPSHCLCPFHRPPNS